MLKPVHKHFLIVATVAGVIGALLLSGCGEKGSATASSRKATESPAITQPNSNSGNSTESRLSRNGNTQLLVLGGFAPYGFDLYTISTNARESIPVKFANSRLEYLEVAPMAATGRAIAVGRDRYGSAHSVQLLNFNTNASYSLYSTTGPRLSGTIGSRDGHWVAFAEQVVDTGEGRIKLIHVDSEKVIDVPLPQNVARANTPTGPSGPVGIDDRNPRFGPDGTTLIFERRTKESMSIVKASLSELAVAEMAVLLTTATSEAVSHFQYAPDQVSYVYTRKNGKRWQLIAKIGDKEEFAITDPQESGHEPSWSPSGREIVFWSDSRDMQAIKTYNIRSGKASVVAKIMAPATRTDADIARGHYNVCPIWSADEREIYFASNGGIWDQIFKVTLPEKAITRLNDSNLPPSVVCPRLMQVESRRTGGNP